MSTATIHFGPEWMRTKNRSLSRSEPSPPLVPSALPSTLATYSALVSVTPVVSGKLDESHPFRYSKGELLAIYQEGVKGGLGLEVDRWEGVVREVAVEPITLREMTDAEKKLFTGSLNSETRRRPSQTTDHISPLSTSSLERSKMMSGSSVSPLRERFGAMKRKDSTGATADSSTARKPSLSTMQVPSLLSQTSPRTRVGHTSNFDGVLNNGESWVARRRLSEASIKASNSSNSEFQARDSASKAEGAVEVAKEHGPLSEKGVGRISSTSSHVAPSVAMDIVDASLTGIESLPNANSGYGFGEPQLVLDFADVEWSYKDPTGQVQGPFRADLMQKWYEEGYFTPDLPMKRTYLDSQWFTVQELIMQASSANVFLTPPLSQDSGVNRPSPVPEYSQPYQPTPIRSLAAHTPLATDPQISTFTSSQLENIYPDPALAGRDKNVHHFGLPVPSTSSFIGNHLSNNGFVHDPSSAIEGHSSGRLLPNLDTGLNGRYFNSQPIKVQDPSSFPHSPFSITNANLTLSPGAPAEFFDDTAERGYIFDLAASNHLNFTSHRSVPMISAPTHELSELTGNQRPYPDFVQNQITGQTSSLVDGSDDHVIHNSLVTADPGTVTVATRLESNVVYENGGRENVTTIGGTAPDEKSAIGMNRRVDSQDNAPQELAQPLSEKLQPSPVSPSGKSASKLGKPSLRPRLDQTPPDNSVAQASRSVWAKDDDGKGKKGVTGSISLRAIQEAEAKRQQSLKASERERERTRVSVISENKEDLQSFTTSWGLPTSQAGTRSKDIPVIATVQMSQTSPVWTTTVNAAVKKSMKEIQEEEEKRKKHTSKENSMTLAKKFVENTTKMPSSPTTAALLNNSPWTTIGPNGKVAAPVQSSRTPTSFSSAVISPSVASRSTVNQRVVTSPPKLKPVKPGEVPEAPSHEFLKWLGESLTGLNSSANVEEIMSMLFSFPLDPDSSTLEIISDTIYSNSTTLDGRRFAADFVTKRKADASRSKGPLGKVPANNSVSIADVVKAVPKSTQPEWGFKVVNKKKKGGRL